MFTKEDSAIIDLPKDPGDGLADAVDFLLSEVGHRNMQTFVNGDLQFPGGTQPGIDFDQRSVGVASRNSPSFFPTKLAENNPRDFNLLSAHREAW